MVVGTYKATPQSPDPQAELWRWLTQNGAADPSTTGPLLTVSVTSAPATSATGTQTSVASSATDVTILASNASREGAVIYNDSTQILYLLLASGTSSTSNYSVQVPSQSYFEVPGPSIYTGVIKGIWAAANGNARVTEFTG